MSAVERLIMSKNTAARHIGWKAHCYLASRESDGGGPTLEQIIEKLRIELANVDASNRADAVSVIANLQRIANLKALYKQGYTAREARAIVEGGER